MLRWVAIKIGHQPLCDITNGETVTQHLGKIGAPRTKTGVDQLEQWHQLNCTHGCTQQSHAQQPRGAFGGGFAIVAPIAQIKHSNEPPCTIKPRHQRGVNRNLDMPGQNMQSDGNGSNHSPRGAGWHPPQPLPLLNDALAHCQNKRQPSRCGDNHLKNHRDQHKPAKLVNYPRKGGCIAPQTQSAHKNKHTHPGNAQI